MSARPSAGVVGHVVAAGWIPFFGLLALTAPPMDVATSLALFTIGVVVVPVLALMRGRRARPTDPRVLFGTAERQCAR